MKPIPTVKESKKVNKLLVVGHKESDLNSVKNLLLECNVNDAKNLNKEKITPQEISNILLKAHSTEECEESTTQLNINPVWNGLAMDLMMSNIDSTLWVWEDPKAISLLEYWKSLDANLAFILVYTSPEQFIINFVQNNSMDKTEILEDEFQKWVSYNRVLLNFYYRNQDISVLVNSEQVISNSNMYLEQLEQQIGLQKEQLTHELTMLTKGSNSKSLPSNNIIAFLAQRLISDEMQSLYDEMQSIANLPLDNHSVNTVSPYKVLQQYNTEQQELEHIKREYASKKQELINENKLQCAQLMNLQEELEKIYFEKQELEKKFKLAKEDELKKVQEENKYLLEQLHQVQEELEKNYFEQKVLKNKQPSISSEERHYGAAERIKQQLSYRLGNKMIENSKSFGGIIILPFALYGEVKKFRKEKKIQKKLPPLHIYTDAHDAERVKKHLSYKLGQAMINTMKSPIGLIKLPFALKKAHTEYKKERR